MRCLPDHRLQAVRNARSSGTLLPPDPRMQGLHRLFQKLPDVPVDVADAWELYQVFEHRVILDAFFLAGAPESLIALIFGIEPASVATYGYLFMDMTVFRNRLEIITFSGHYNHDGRGREITSMAARAGLEYMVWAYSGEPSLAPEVLASGVVSPGTTEITRRTMIDAFYKGMAHKGNSVITTMAKEALKWWQYAAHNVAILEKLDPEGKQLGNDAVAVALKAQDETLGTEQRPVPINEILS